MSMDRRTPSRATERAAIFEIWQRVTEDYAPFDVNVTTVDPGVEALRRTGTIDVAFGQRVVISPTNWYAPASSCTVPGQSCTLGIALVGVFDRNSDTPAFAFTGGVSVRTIAEAVSHEVGHTFGLNHDRDGVVDVLQRSWSVGADHGSRHGSVEAVHAMVEGRVCRGQQRAGRPRTDCVAHRLPARRSQWRIGAGDGRVELVDDHGCHRHHRRP